MNCSLSAVHSGEVQERWWGHLHWKDLQTKHALHYQKIQQGQQPPQTPDRNFSTGSSLVTAKISWEMPGKLPDCPLCGFQIKDEAFDEAEKNFRLQERLIKSFIRDISLYLQHIRVTFHMLKFKIFLLKSKIYTWLFYILTSVSWTREWKLHFI